MAPSRASALRFHDAWTALKNGPFQANVVSVNFILTYLYASIRFTLFLAEITFFATQKGVNISQPCMQTPQTFNQSMPGNIL